MLSYEKAKELETAGFGETAAKWVISHDSTCPDANIYYTPEDSSIYELSRLIEIVSCPSFEEIWARLPRYITFQNNQYSKELHVASIGYWNLNEEIDPEAMYNEYVNKNNITEAAADLWLLLKKEGII